MRKILNRGAKRRLRRKQQSARRSRTRSMIRGLEPLEERRLLAVSPDGNWGQLINPAGPATNLTGTVAREFSIPFGADRAIAVVANYTTTSAISLFIDLDKDGTNDFKLTTQNAVPTGFAGANTLGGIHPDVEGHQLQATSPPGGPAETLNTTIWIIPLGPSSMAQDVRVTLTGSTSADFIATVSSYQGVNQLDPVRDANATALSGVPPAGPFAFSQMTIPNVSEASVTLDGIMVLARNAPNNTITDLVPDPLNADFSPVDQTEVLDKGHTPSSGNFFRGAASHDDADDTDLDNFANMVQMDWRFDPSGGAAYTHVGIEIQMDTSPDVNFVFDFGDAPDTYGTTLAKGGAFHAPKGAMLGDFRDAEMNGAPSVGADGDDLAGVPDDEDGVINFFTNGNAFAGGFVSQWMGTNIGSVDVEVNLTKDKNGIEIPAYVTAYIDWNIDGDFKDANELVISGAKYDKSGTQTLKFNIPMSADVKEGTSYVRVRLSEATMGDPQTLPPGGHASSGEVEDYTVGLVHGAEVHGIKFEDIDADGIRDLGEPGMPGIVVELKDSGGAQAKDLFGKAVAPVITDKDGKFWFVNLDGGKYTVVENLAKSDTNNDKVLDAGDTIGGFPVDQGLRPSTATSKAVEIKDGECIDGITFGNYITGSIHGVKFHDLDGDGVWDGNEPALKGVSFDLYKFVKTTTTIKATGGGSKTTYQWTKVDTEESDVHGEFWFVNLDPGIYEVVEQQSATIKQSTSQPTKDPNTLNTNPATSTTAYPIVSRREFVWQAGAASRIMDLNGNQTIEQFEIDHAKAKGALKVEVLATPAVDAAPADKAQDLWFGNFLLGTITGFKFHDLDRDGKFEPGDGEKGYPGVKMDLIDKDGKIVQTVKTDANGNFSFIGAAAGDYTVTESPLTDTHPTTGVGDGTPDVDQDLILDPFVEAISIASGSTVKLKHDFANYITGSIHGIKFLDADGDGVWDKNDKDAKGNLLEPTLDGIKFDLYKFIKSTTKQPASAPAVTTFFWEDVGDATSTQHGEFWFTKLDPGTYEVRERSGQTDKNGVPFGQTTKQPTSVPGSSTDPSKSTWEFLISSGKEYVWEIGAASRPIDGMGGPLDGFIDAKEVQAGYNKGALKTQILATPTNPDTPGDTTDGNDENQDLWFGNILQTSTIIGFKYHDVDKSGTFNTGDAPLPNVKMLLTGKTVNGVAVSKTAITDANGIFTFSGLAPSDATGYTIVEDPASGDAFVNEPGDGTPDIQQDLVVTGKGTATVVLAGNTTKDFTLKDADKNIWGNYVFGSIHGVKFHDLDGDGTWDKGTAPGSTEPALQGIKFDLFQYVGKSTTKFVSGKTVVTHQWKDVGDGTSNIHGEFWFNQLSPGQYLVVEQKNADWVQTTGQVKDPNGVVIANKQIGVDPADGKTGAFVIVSRREFVWELGAASRAIDGMPTQPVDGIIDSKEVQAGYNKGALKIEVLATPANPDVETPVDDPSNNGSQDLWFGNFRAGIINGFKFEDRNQNSVYDPAIDVPLKGATMLLNGTDSKGNVLALSTKTAGDGTFSFGGLLPSDANGYIISESTATDTNNDTTPDNKQEMILDASTSKVVLGSGQTVNLDKNLWGNFVLGSIHGFKFHDKDGDGVFDQGEEPLKDIVFDLYKFEKTETVLLASNVTKTIFHWSKVASEKTDLHGEFWFTGLNSGKYQVVEQKGGFDLTTGQATKSPAPVDNTKVPDGDFLDSEDFQGLNPNSANIFTILSRQEYVWEFGASKRPRDLDANGIIDANEIQMAYNKSVLKTEIIAAPAAQSTLFDAGGFEAPAFTTTAFGNGMLEGQPIGAPIVWQRTVFAGPSTATIQNTVFAPGGGTQAVQMNRAAGATDRWGLKFTNAPLTNTVTINWAMRVQGPAGNPATQFGPFFGVEAYDDTTQIGLIGSLGVDATTGDVLYQAANTGFFTETGATVAFGAWNNFEIRMNFSTKQYSVFLNGNFLRTEGFVDQTNVPGGLNKLTDATLTGLTAAANSDALTGTAYFDNFVAKDVGTANAPSLWFGNVMRGTINGFKYEDINNDSKFDAAIDKPLKDAKFELKDSKGVVVQTVKSGADGKFTFPGVLPGTYTVNEAASTDTNGDGTPDNQQEMVLDPRVANVTLTSVIGGQTKDVGNFRDYILGSIHGVKFQDFDNDGKWDKSGNQAEPPWAGIKFDLFKLVKQETILLASNISKTVYTWQDTGDATTDIHGEFWFTGLDPGSYYTVREQSRPDVEQTTDQPTKSPVGIDANKDGDFLDAGDFAGLDPNSNNSNAFLILSRQEYVWELGASARPRDLNNDGVISKDEQQMAYNKSVLKVEVLANGGDTSKGIDLIFGNNFITGSIHGFKFEDIDADGIWDQANPKTKLGAEPGLGGIVIELHDTKGNVPLLANGKVARTRTVGGDDPSTPWVEKKGEFWFMGVMPGTYTIHEVLEKSDSNGDLISDDEQGMVASTPTSTGPITVGPREEWVYTPGAAHLTKGQIAKGVHEVFQDGANSNNVNEKLIFGNYITGSIHGFKFLDLNADGKYDPSAMGKERPFEWGAFELIDMSGKSLGIQFTDENGEFWFTDLKPGKYTVRERPDLIDRNDLDGDGHPDIVDANKDGLPEQMGNKVPDTKEGLMVSTPIETTVQIWSREELVWQDGAAMLGKDSTVNVEPDDYPDGKFDIPVDIQDGYPNVVLTEAITGNPIFSITPDDFSPTTGDQAFGHDVDLVFFFEESFGFAGDQGIFQAQFDVPVKSVSIDVIANSGNDRGVLIAYDTNGVFLGSVTTSLLNDTDVNINNDWQKLTFNAPAGTSIGFIQAGGDGLSASDVGLDNLQYVVSSLKEEKLVGTQLMWGDFYAGAIHGLKLQQDSNLPAPNIRIQLIDQFGQKIRVNDPDIGRVDPNGAFDYVETDAQGKFWFLDVKPGFYTISELPSPAVIMMAMPVPVVVGHAEVIAAPGSMPMPYPGLQTVVSNNALTLRNLIEGSIHGLVCNQFNQPVPNQTVILNGVESATTTTNALGQFHFNDLTPGAYVVNVNGILRIVIVGSGEEEVAMAGLASPLDPGQFEQLNPDLKIITQGGPDPIGPKVASVKVVSSQWTEPFLDEVDPVDGLGYPVPTGADQLKTLPWININEILVKFNEPMNITAADISLHGVSVANYATAFNYDAPSRTASIQLTGGNLIGADKLVLHINDTAKDLAGNALDGEWVNGVSNYGNTGNGTPGGDFNFRINVLPGDSRQDGQNLGQFDGVLGTDVIKVRNAQFLTTTDATYSPFDDVNGSGNVSGVDVVAVRNRQFTGLPAGNPVAPPASGASLVDSVFGTGASFGKGDDDDLLLALATGSGSSIDAVFESAVGGDSDGEAGAVGSIDDLFAALGS